MTALPPDKLNLAFDLAPIGLCVSRQRVIQHCNLAFEQMFGYERGELSGESLACLYPSPQEFEQIGERGHVIMRESGLYSDDRIMKASDGRLFWCHVTGRSLERTDPFAFAVWAFEDLSTERPVTVALTAREREIAQFLVTGKTSKQIAAVLNVSPRTVEAHRARLMVKLKVNNTGELIARLIGGGR